MRDGDESGIDCGGSCNGCPDGQPCDGDGDCASGRCESGTCQPPLCGNGIKDQDESDVDCGGRSCPRCNVGAACRYGDDCVSKHCKNERCIVPRPVQLAFAPPVLYPMPGDPSNPVVGDFNGDGRVDVAVAMSGDFFVLLGRGNGSFSAPVQYTSYGPIIASADLDDDGRTDVAFTNRHDVTILFGQDAGFSAPLVLPAFDQAGGLAFGDVDGDGRRDIVVAAQGIAGGVVFLGGKDRAFKAGPTFDGGINDFWGIAAGDLDGDGKADVVTAPGAVAPIVYGGAAVGALRVLWSNAPANFGAGGLALGHFDGDGLLDVAMTTYGPLFECFLGKGKGALGMPTMFGQLGGAAPRWALAADFDGDGWDDLAAGGFSDGKMMGKLAVFAGHGDGTFSSQLDLSLPGRLRGVVAADLNGDHLPDLVTSLTTPNQAVAVILNTTR